MLNLELIKARSEDLQRRARSSRLAKHVHRSAVRRGGRRRLLELRVGLAYVRVRWGLPLLRPDPPDELDAREVERLLDDAA